MPSKDSTIYVVTGSARGIGLGLVTSLATRPNVIVFAGVRSLPAPESPLAKLISANPNVLIPVVINSADASDNEAAAEYIKAKVGRVDVVIANAGMAPRSNYIIEANADDTMEAFRVNTIGPMVLFKSFHLLLKASSHAKFVIVSSGAGSMGDGRVAPFPIIEYAMSKTAVNYLAWKIHHEHADVIAFSLNPGAVMTDMGTKAFQEMGLTKEMAIELKASVELEDSVAGILKLSDNATKEKTSGKFWDWDGKVLPW